MSIFFAILNETLELEQLLNSLVTNTFNII